MTGLEGTSAGLDVRRKRNLYRAWHRGMREMDLLMGPFAEARLGDMSEEELDQFEALLDIPDQDLFSYITGTKEMPEDVRLPIYDTLLAFHGDLLKRG
ncbi:MAG: succinate dehydrogenase assembly factor 2 [Hyphomicrobiales bacterium]|nr:MAG: succinate dehydrogenase assembly factor 2 [Hyphomicrobiales bacterium]